MTPLISTTWKAPASVVFIDEVQRALSRITEFPEAGLLIRQRVRRRMLVGFPYSLLYSVRDTGIRVLAVAHHRRRPFYWRGRR